MTTTHQQPKNETTTTTTKTIMRYDHPSTAVKAKKIQVSRDDLDKALDVMLGRGWLLRLDVLVMNGDGAQGEERLVESNIDIIINKKQVSLFVCPFTCTVSEVKTLLADKVGIPEKNQKLYIKPGVPEDDDNEEGNKNSQGEEDTNAGEDGEKNFLLYGKLPVMTQGNNAVFARHLDVVLEQFSFSESMESMMQILGYPDSDWKLRDKVLASLLKTSRQYVCFHGRALCLAAPRTEGERPFSCWQCHRYIRNQSGGEPLRDSVCCGMAPFVHPSTSNIIARIIDAEACCPLELCMDCAPPQLIEIFDEYGGGDPINYCLNAESTDPYQAFSSFIVDKYKGFMKDFLRQQHNYPRDSTFLGMNEDAAIVPLGMKVDIRLGNYLKQLFEEASGEDTPVTNFRSEYPRGATVQTLLELVRQRWIMHLAPKKWTQIVEDFGDNQEMRKQFFSFIINDFTMKVSVAECSNDLMVLVID